MRDDTDKTANADLMNEFVAVCKEFVDEQVCPAAPELERNNEFPEELVRQMKDLGVFAMLVPEEFGGLGLDLRTYWRVVSELCRGWMSLGGILNSHTITAYLLTRFGTHEQQERFLPSMATGELRAALAMTEAGAGSDLAAIKTSADDDGSDFVINGSKMFITNGARAGVIATLVRTDRSASPPHKGMSVLLVERGPGVTAGRKIDKLGYNGVETVPLTFEDARTPRSSLLGGNVGQGFYQVLAGGEVGRLNVGARAHGLTRSAIDEATRYALERETFGKPIAEHQAVQFLLADMVTNVHAAAGLLDQAADALTENTRADLETGMAKLFATEMAVEASLAAMRIHGGYGYTKEFVVERLYRDAPQMVIAEGTNEIQRTIIAKAHLERFKASRR